MWREHLYKESSPANKSVNCAQCPVGLLKYVELSDFPSAPIRFFIDRSSSPSSSTGVIQIHYWTATPPSSPPFTTRVWLANIKPGGGNFMFQPTPGRKHLSLFKKNGSNIFDAVCFKYIPESRLFVPQTFS
jgi:hypothetical protein